MSYRWAVLAAGTVAQASFSTVSFAIAVLAPALREEYDLSLTEIGVVLAAEWIGLTFALLTWVIFSGIALFSGTLGVWLRTRPRLASSLSWLTGSVLVSLGLRLAFSERR